MSERPKLEYTFTDLENLVVAMFVNGITCMYGHTSLEDCKANDCPSELDVGKPSVTLTMPIYNWTNPKPKGD